MASDDRRFLRDRVTEFDRKFSDKFGSWVIWLIAFVIAIALCLWPTMLPVIT